MVLLNDTFMNYNTPQVGIAAVEVLELVRRSPLSKHQTLLELGVACSTYYR